MTFASPLFTRTAIAFAFLFLAIYTLTFFDPRLIYGVSFWEKPSKFFLSLTVHMATLAWGISLLPAETAAQPRHPHRHLPFSPPRSLNSLT